MNVKSGEKIKCLSKKDNIQERHIGSLGMKAMRERIALSSKYLLGKRETKNEQSNTTYIL